MAAAAPATMDVTITIPQLKVAEYHRPYVAIWVEKGFGLVIPGFVPSPLGEIVEYTPTLVEVGVTAGVWALGFFVLTILVRVALPIEMGSVRSPHIGPEGPPVIRPRPEGRTTARWPVRTR